MLEDLRQAKRSIHLEYYIWTNDEFTQEVKDVLIDKAQAGVKIYLYENDTCFHPKTLNIDSAICSIGTVNMDIRSFSINYEVNAVVYDTVTAGELARDFMRDIGRCRQFDLGAYLEQPITSRLVDLVYRLASLLLKTIRLSFINTWNQR